MTHDAVRPGGPTLIRLDGVFDAVAAWDLRRRLGAFPRDASVVLDFTQVRELADLGVAVMASALAQREGPCVALRGLCEHHYRLFRYLGVDVAKGGAVADALPAATSARAIGPVPR